MRDGRIRRIRVVGSRLSAPEPRRRDALEAVVGILQMLKAILPFGAVGRRPAGTRPKGIEVLVHEKVVQCIGRVVDVENAGVAGQHPRRLVQPRRDSIGDLLLPVRARIAREQMKQEGKHRSRETTLTTATQAGVR